MYNPSCTLEHRVQVWHNGSINWHCASEFRTSCVMDVTTFPFDKQMCAIVIENGVHSIEQVDLLNHLPVVEMQNFRQNGVWSIENTSTGKVKVKTSPGIVLPRLIMTVYLRRKPGYYLLNLLLPVVLVTVSSTAIFWLPVDSGEKVSLGITVMLAYSVMQLTVDSYLPTTSDERPMLGEYTYSHE